MKLDVAFEITDLFLYQPSRPADVLVSLGVLHHTNDCAAALRHWLTECARQNGDAIIGLYHGSGWRPFLDHFPGDGRSRGDRGGPVRLVSAAPQPAGRGHRRPIVVSRS